jgi:hypothetical protein
MPTHSKNNPRLACNISAYARARKCETIIKKGKENIKTSITDLAT